MVIKCCFHNCFTDIFAQPLFLLLQKADTLVEKKLKRILKNFSLFFPQQDLI